MNQTKFGLNSLSSFRESFIAKHWCMERQWTIRKKFTNFNLDALWMNHTKFGFIGPLVSEKTLLWHVDCRQKSDDKSSLENEIRMSIQKTPKHLTSRKVYSLQKILCFLVSVILTLKGFAQKYKKLPLAQYEAISKNLFKLDVRFWSCVKKPYFYNFFNIFFLRLWPWLKNQ